MMQTASLQSKGTKKGGQGSGVEVWEQEENVLEMAPVGLQEGAGGLSFTAVCIPKGMHRCSRVRDNHTAAVLSMRRCLAEMKTYYCEC